MLIPEPMAGLWRALAQPGGADRAALEKIVDAEDETTNSEVVNRFLSTLSSAGLIEETPEDEPQRPKGSEP